MLNWLHELFEGRYVRTLEADLERLRGENRALLNSLLGTAGFPPVEFPAQIAAPRELPRPRRRSWHQMQAWRASEGAKESRSQRNVNERGQPNL